MNQDFHSSLKLSVLLIRHNFHITITKYYGVFITHDLYSQRFSLEYQSRQISMALFFVIFLYNFREGRTQGGLPGCAIANRNLRNTNLYTR